METPGAELGGLLGGHFQGMWFFHSFNKQEVSAGVPVPDCYRAKGLARGGYHQPSSWAGQWPTTHLTSGLWHGQGPQGAGREGAASGRPQDTRALAWRPPQRPQPPGTSAGSGQAGGRTPWELLHPIGQLSPDSHVSQARESGGLRFLQEECPKTHPSMFIIILEKN